LTDETNDDAANDNAATSGQSALDFWRGLAEIARESQLAEMEVEQNGVRVTLRSQSALAAENAPLNAPIYGAMPQIGAMPGAPTTPAGDVAPSTPAGNPAVKAVEENLATIVSPMVGMFYRAPSPSDPNFVEIGDKVEIGQTVALVEAMKVFNEITAEISGVVVEIKANSGDLVETGQVLLTIR
jgi:acetyl-CoA carboxylase biotin carboxyl carrier protein